MGEYVFDDMDRATKGFYEARSHETWYGLVLQIADRTQIKSIKSGLDKILSEHDQKLSVSGGCAEIYLKGAYIPKLLDKIEDYLTKQRIPYLIGEGEYADFIGWRDWIKEMKENQTKRA